jgi:hypothetical protein
VAVRPGVLEERLTKLGDQQARLLHRASCRHVTGLPVHGPQVEQMPDAQGRLAARTRTRDPQRNPDAIDRSPRRFLTGAADGAAVRAAAPEPQPAGRTGRRRTGPGQACGQAARLPRQQRGRTPLACDNDEVTEMTGAHQQSAVRLAAVASAENLG